MTTNLNATVQVAATGMMYAMTLNVFASAIGMLAATAVIPAGIPVTDKGIRDLRLTFGTDLVSLAIKNVGKDDILILAKEVSELYTDRMRKKYGDFATTQALAAAPPGDLRTANEIAAAIAGQKITESTAEDVKEKAVTTGKKRGRQVAQPVRDTKTGTVYPSKARAGMAVATEYGLEPTNHFAWYEVIKQDPDRFVRV